MKVKTRSKVKFYSTSVRTRVIPILKRIEGNYPSKVARILGMSKQHVHYYIKKLVTAGLVKRLRPRWPARYRLTERGKKFLTRCEGLAPGFAFRLHNCVFKYRVLEGSLGPGGWRRVERVNWSSLIGSELGLTVEKTTRNILVYCDVIEGRNPNELLLLAKDQADRVAAHLRLKYGLRLGEGKLARKPHLGVYDPIAALVSRHWQISDDIAKIDRSETYGEIDWLTPEAAKDYLLMPGLVRRILEVQRNFAQGMADHRAMIREIRELVRELRGVKGRRRT